MTRATDRVLTEVIFDWSPNPGSALGYVFPTVLAHNVVWFWTGRHSGVVPYFFPAVFALACFLWPRARREWWQWLVLRRRVDGDPGAHRLDPVQLLRRCRACSATATS